MLAIEAVHSCEYQINPHYVDHQVVTAFYFRHQSQLFNARQTATANDIELHEADIRLTDRYLMERFIYGV